MPRYSNNDYSKMKDPSVKIIEVVVDKRRRNRRKFSNPKALHRLWEVALNHELICLFFLYYHQIIQSKLHLAFTIIRIVGSALLNYENESFNMRFRFFTKMIDATYLAYVALTLPSALIILNTSYCVSSVLFRYAWTSAIYLACVTILYEAFDIDVFTEGPIFGCASFVFLVNVIYQGYYCARNIVTPTCLIIVLCTSVIIYYVHCINCYFYDNRVTEPEELISQTLLTLFYSWIFVHLLFMIGGCQILPEYCYDQTQGPFTFEILWENFKNLVFFT